MMKDAQHPESVAQNSLLFFIIRLEHLSFEAFLADSVGVVPHKLSPAAAAGLRLQFLALQNTHDGS